MNYETPAGSDCQIARRLLEHCDSLSELLSSAATTAQAVDSAIRKGKQRALVGSGRDDATELAHEMHQTLAASQRQLRRIQLRVENSTRPLIELGRQLGVEPGTRGWVQRLVSRLQPAQRHHVSARLFDLKQRYREIMALSVANQTVLVYSLDFCRRLLGDQAPQTLSYNRHGTGEAPAIHRSVTRSRVC